MQMDGGKTEGCFSYEMITSNGMWGDDAKMKDFSLPIFLTYLVLTISTSSALAFLLKRFHQPRVIAEIITGIIWGPTLAGQFIHDTGKRDSLFTTAWRINLLKTAGHMGLLFFVFLIGVDTDFDQLARTAGKSLAVAGAITIAPFAVVIVAIAVLKDGVLSAMDHSTSTSSTAGYLLVLALFLSATSLPVVARVVSDLKLLNTDLGRIALSAAVFNEAAAWGILSLLLRFVKTRRHASTDDEESAYTNPWSVYAALACSIVMIPALVAAGRMGVSRIHRRTPDGETVTNAQLSFVLAGALACAFCTDGVGIHYAVGAFVFGLSIPPGPVAAALSEMLDQFVSRLLLPLFFVIPGMTINYAELLNVMDPHAGSSSAVVFLTLLSAAVKVSATLGVSLLFSTPLHEGLALALLLNCRSLVEVMLLDTGETQTIMKQPPFTAIATILLLMTVAAPPAVVALYRPSRVRALLGYQCRNMELSKSDSELRILACVHGARNVPAIISFLEIANPTKRYPIHVLALHLVELIGRGTSTLVTHSTGAAVGGSSRKHGSFTLHSEHIISAFLSYKQKAAGVSVQPLTNTASYDSMHDDVCAVAGEKRAAIIILPFHRQLAVDGGMEVPLPAVQSLNRKVMELSPCSVAILVDRGLSGGGRYAGGNDRSIVVLFFGGPDDREALACAWRMAEKPRVTVTIVRFLVWDDNGGAATAAPLLDGERERRLDEECVNEFRLRFVSDDSVVYLEKVVSSSEETLEAIRVVDGGRHDLYLVGRRDGVESPLTAGLSEWSEFPELGPIGDLLASTDFGVTVSVLVVQQYVCGGSGRLVVAMPDSPGRMVKEYLKSANHKVRSALVRPAPGFKQGWDGAV